jgi:pSer/pThr/pTyr-binding forkhead associated (FHA) protein
VSSPENPDVLAQPVAEAAPIDAAAPAGDAFVFEAGSTPKLVVNRGLKQNVEYPVYEGQNFLGRADEKPVDIDLDDQEPPDRVWSSRQHALITFEAGVMNIEDLNSANGTFVNRQKVHPGAKQSLKPDDVIQVGTVQLKVKV